MMTGFANPKPLVTPKRVRVPPGAYQDRWLHKDPGDAITEFSTIYSGDFSQLRPDTPIMAGRRVTIAGGDFTNVRLDPAWKVRGGTWKQVSRCSHVHPEWVAKGLPECPEQCEHSYFVGTVRHYADKEIA